MTRIVDETSEALSNQNIMQEIEEVPNQLTHLAMLAINHASMTHNHTKVRYQNMYQTDRP